MNILAIMGSYRKGCTIDTITDKVLEGAESKGANVEKVVLLDQHIEYCRNCFTCYRDADASIGKCSIDDDTRSILEKIMAADGLVLASSVNIGSITALMKTFLERSCWTLARPTGRYLWLKGIPEPRNPPGQKRAVVITSAGIAPWYLRFLLSYPEHQMVSAAQIAFCANVIGTMFVGAIQNRKLSQKEYAKAIALGQDLAAEKLPILTRWSTELRMKSEPLVETIASLIKP